MIKLTESEALQHIWNMSKEIRDWYLTEHNFDLGDIPESDYRVFGITGSGDIVCQILQDGINDKLVVKDDNGDYWRKL